MTILFGRNRLYCQEHQFHPTLLKSTRYAILASYMKKKSGNTGNAYK